MNLRQQLQQQDPLLGTLVTLPTPAVAELLALAGCDWLFIDAEHAPLSNGDVQALLQAASDTPCLVRLPQVSESAVKRALDAGAAGIIAPMVNDAATAVSLVQWAKYPPQGTRSVGVARAHGYGLHFQETMQRANAETAVVIQIEHIDGVNNIEEIVAVPGIDAIFIGPYDLSATLGKPGEVNDPAVTTAITRVEVACEEANVPLGAFGMDAAAVRPFIKRGYTLLAVGIDTVMLARTMQAALSDLRSTKHKLDE